jgi:transcriptional regulator with XRE-family HTH domain
MNIVKSTRQSLGLSIEGFARAFRVSRDSVERWEGGKVAIPGPVIVLCEMAGASQGAFETLGNAGAAKPAGRPKSE